MRRSLTVTPENDKKILLTKGRFLTGDAPLDIDYITMVNIFIELGHKLMSSAWIDNTKPNITIDKNEIIESFKKHAFSSELKEESVGDQVTEIIFRKLVEQTNLSDKLPNQQQQQQNQLSPAISNPETDEKASKKYVT